MLPYLYRAVLSMPWTDILHYLLFLHLCCGVAVTLRPRTSLRMNWVNSFAFPSPTPFSVTLGGVVSVWYALYFCLAQTVVVSIY